MRTTFTIATVAILLLSFQIIKTQLSVTIRDGLGNTVDGATVQLFENLEDYEAEKNPVAASVTDEKGVAKFKDLQAVSYFVLAKKDDQNNFGAGEKTEKLEAKKINKVTIVID